MNSEMAYWAEEERELLSIFFFFCFFLKMSTNVQLHPPFVTLMPSATTQLALTTALASQDTLATEKLVKIREKRQTVQVKS